MQRRTKQRDAVQEAITGSNRPLSPAEILESARAAVESLSLATVYRTVKSLVDEGVVVPVELPGEAPRYEAADLGHHHHFHCTRCDRAFDLPGCPVSLANAVPEGFVVEGHELTLHGCCPECATA